MTCQICHQPIKTSITTCADCLRHLYNQWLYGQEHAA